MGLKQFNGEWVAGEDRILFRVSTSEGQEFQLWLTRHIVKHFLAGARQLTLQSLTQSHPPQVAQAMHAFEQQSVTQQLDLGRPYEPQPERPLGDAPALVRGLSINVQGQQAQVDLDTATNLSVHLHLNDGLLRMMVGLLEKLQVMAGWDLPQPDVASVVVPEGAGSRLH